MPAQRIRWACPMWLFDLSGGTFNDTPIATANATIVGWLAGWDSTTVPQRTYTSKALPPTRREPVPTVLQ